MSATQQPAAQPYDGSLYTIGLSSYEHRALMLRAGRLQRLGHGIYAVSQVLSVIQQIDDNGQCPECHETHSPLTNPAIVAGLYPVVDELADLVSELATDIEDTLQRSAARSLPQ